MTVEGLKTSGIGADTRAVEPREEVNDDAIRVLDGLHAEISVFFEVEPGTVLPGDFGNEEEGTDFSGAFIDGVALGFG